MFIGREKEISELNMFLEDKDVNAICVYGRRGIGKTTLLKNYLSDKRHIYFTAYQTTDIEELHLFAVAAGIAKKPKSLDEVLDAVTKQVEAMTLDEDEQFFLCIDHYGDFVKADADYEIILQDYVNVYWSSKPIKVIFCEDLYLNVDKYITGKKSTWKKGKVSLLEVEPLNYVETKAFCGIENSEEAAFIYGLTGGVPALINKIKGLTGVDAVKTLYFDEAGENNRPENRIGLELRELSYYNRMLTALAAGNTRVNQISNLVGKPKDVVVPYFNTLMSIGVVQKQTPITEKTNRKKTRYSIVNSSDEFWYRFVATHMDLYYTDQRDKLVEHIENGKNDFMHDVFVKMCKEYLLQKSAKQELPFTIDELGNWWVNDEDNGTSQDFDLVALGKQQGKSATIFGRCYYSDTPVDLRELKELIDLTKLLEHNGDRFYLVFSKAGFNETAKTAAAAIWNIMLISLDDIC